MAGNKHKQTNKQQFRTAKRSWLDRLLFDFGVVNTADDACAFPVAATRAWKSASRDSAGLLLTFDIPKGDQLSLTLFVNHTADLALSTLTVRRRLRWAVQQFLLYKLLIFRRETTVDFFYMHCLTITGLDRTYITLIILFLVSHFNFLFIPCGID